MREPIKRVTHLASMGLLYAGAAGLVLMTAVVGWQVFGRYVLGSSPSWSEQAALTLMIWYVSFAAAAGVREGFHIRIVALETAAPPRVRALMRAAANVVVALAGIAMAIWGGELVARTWSHVIPTLGLPRGVAYLPIPASGLLMAIFAIEGLLDARSDAPPPQTGDDRWS